MTMLGSVGSLWRYPVKSMLGERIDACEVGDRGVAGDRAYALLDVATGKVVSAKHPRLWGGMFSFSAAYLTEPVVGDAPPLVRITLPDGSTITSDDASVDESLSEAIGRKVVLSSSPPKVAKIEEEWLDIEGAGPHRSKTTEETLAAVAPGTFFDATPLHVLTTSSLARFAELSPESAWDERRFRPNVVVRTDGAGFVENEWAGREVRLGDVVMMGLVPAPRCVMTTLPQGDLPRDAGILRTPAEHNRLDVPTYGPGACVGLYGVVVQGGAVRLGDPVT